MWLTRTGIVHGSIFLKILLLLYPYQLSSDQISTVAFNVCLTLNTYFTCTKDLYYCTVNSDRFFVFSQQTTVVFNQMCTCISGFKNTCFQVRRFLKKQSELHVV